MANRNRHRATRTKGALIWTVVGNTRFQINAGVTVSGSDIVEDTDWTTVGGQERATLMRIRGWFSVNQGPVGVLTASGPVSAYIGLFDADEAAPSASAINTYVDEDILATYGHGFPYTDIGESPGTFWDQHVDVKAMRKIRTGQDVRFVITNDNPTAVYISFIMRALVKRS